jgi:hypothetical protein
MGAAANNSLLPPGRLRVDVMGPADAAMMRYEDYLLD